MLNPDFELDRLRWSLQDKEWLPQEIDQIIELAAEDINNIILDVISNASASAIGHAETIGAEEFIADIDIVQEGALYFVKTKSGKTDYSVERVENLPNLLKNAKSSKDGSLYKVIPIRDKMPKIGINTFQTQLEQQRTIEAARERIIESNRGNRSARANSMADDFRQNLAKTVSSRTKAHPEIRGGVTFRTATSKQNSKTDWVIPEKERDMTQYLVDLNDRIKETVEASVTTIIDFYEKEYA